MLATRVIEELDVFFDKKIESTESTTKVTYL